MKIFNEYKGRTVLITGGLGFIGSNLARRLVALGDVEVIILDALVEGQGGNLHNIHDIQDKITLHIADLGHDWVVNHLVSGVDFIFNLAGNISHLDSMNHPHLDLEHNCSTHLTLLDACRNFNPHVKIIFASTRQVYGKPLYLPLDEEHRIEPPDINAVHKLATEQYHFLYQRLYGTRVSCLRMTNSYGPGQLLHHNRQGFLGWFIKKAIDGEIIELFGEGRQRRDLNFVDDVVDALLLAGASEKADGQVFNLGTNEPVSLKNIAEELIAITGRGSITCVPFPPERQLIDIGNVYSNYKKIESLLGWSPKVSWREGLRRTIEYYQNNRDYYLNPNESSISQFETPVDGIKYRTAGSTTTGFE
jgi:UDP-glucose 4-epimerase